MKKIIILFGSKQGHTASLAEYIKDELQEENYSVTLKNVFEAKADELLNYDIILLGSSTWSDGDLQSDFIPFEREMDNLDLSGKLCAIFGTGSSRFRFFCEAVNILEAKIRSLGGRIVIPALKINDLAKEDRDEEANQWCTILKEELEQMI